MGTRCNRISRILVAAALTGAATAAGSGGSSALAGSSGRSGQGIPSGVEAPGSGLTDVTLTVDAVANIYGAGHDVPPDPGGGGGGALPPAYEFPAMGGQILQFSSVTGTISADGGITFNGPDGSRGPISVRPWDGISGIKDSRGGFYLVGVFLTDVEPHDPAPGAKDFSRSHNFGSISPPLATVFFIGDGKDSLGQVQTFRVPEGATRLFLGLADACNGFGPAGCYDDDLGSLEATFSLG